MVIESSSDEYPVTFPVTGFEVILTSIISSSSLCAIRRTSLALIEVG